MFTGDIMNNLKRSRENFFAGIMRFADIPFHYLKNRRGAKMPDYLISENDENLDNRDWRKG